MSYRFFVLGDSLLTILLQLHDMQGNTTPDVVF